jgi:hypothetical protein
LAVLRERLPFADLRDLERDRRLNRIEDLFTVDLLSSFIAWKLGGSSDAQAPAVNHFPKGLTTSFVSTRI